MNFDYRKLRPMEGGCLTCRHAKAKQTARGWELTCTLGHPLEPCSEYEDARKSKALGRLGDA